MTTTQKPEITWTETGTFTYGRTTYTLHTNTSADSWFAAYKLTGPRGAEYVLCRNKPNPHMLFAINGRKFTATTPFGNGWFTDKSGTLEHVS